jgi:hypothetical protein
MFRAECEMNVQLGERLRHIDSPISPLQGLRERVWRFVPGRCPGAGLGRPVGAERVLAVDPRCPAEDMGNDQPHGRGCHAAGVLTSRSGRGEGALPHGEVICNSQNGSLHSTRCGLLHNPACERRRSRTVTPCSACCSLAISASVNPSFRRFPPRFARAAR